jgi:signal transduction histidine kinase
MARPDRALAVDAGLTGVLGVVFLASTAAAGDARPLDGLGWALLAANILPLLALRRAPLLVVACLSVAYPAWAALEYPTHLLQSLPTLAAMVAVGASPRPLWWRALALLCPFEMLAAAATGIWDVDLLEIGYVAIVFVSGWVLGVVLAARRSYTRALEEKTAALEAARQELAHRAVLEERTRIARDLHDILAHAMSVITVQAGVGGHLLEHDPEQAKGALRVIEETGRGALGEMRRLLGVLRGGDLPTEPQPGLASLDRLAAQTTAAGVPVELQVEGPARPLPAGLEVSAYRIAQEALTNTIKHAPGGRARLTVRYRPHTVELEVVDSGGTAKGVEVEPASGRGSGDSDPQIRGSGESGHGLRGMRERVALYGACSRPGRVPAASGCWPRSPPTRHEHGSGPGPGGGRPGAGQGRLRGPPLVAATAVALWRLRDA